MSSTFGHFDDPAREYVVTDPLTPAPWINYLGNTRLTAFISQQAGGLVFHKEPHTRRISRYHYLQAQQDQPGFYLYVKDHETGTLWNPHFAPTCASLDSYECRHGLGYTRFIGSRDGVEVSVRYFIPPDQDVMLWDVEVTNHSPKPKRLTLSSYLEFGLLEFAREAFWCYLKDHIGFEYDPGENWIKYNYRVFEAPFAPAIFFSCTRQADGFDSSRAAFCGRGGSLERPAALLERGFSGSQIPGGGHGCGALGVDLNLEPGAKEQFAYVLGVSEDWAQALALKRQFSSVAAVDPAFADLQRAWDRKTSVFQAATGDEHVDRSINIWNPLNCQITLERTRDISTDHMGLDGMRYRDTMQDALAVASIDPELAKERIRLIFATQGRDGSGCFSFYPYAPKLKVNEEPRRSDNTVWPIMTVANLVHETGDLAFFDEEIPFRDGGQASVYEHILSGLKYIQARRGPHGLPLLAHADWNDGLAVFHDENAESVMLGMQVVYSAKLFRDFALRFGRDADVAWCDAVIAELDASLNSDEVWDGEWYCRLLLSNGRKIGSKTRPEGQIYLEPQVWSVLSGVGRDGRGRMAMDAAHERLDTRRGLMIHTPPYTGLPNPEDPLAGNAPGAGENGSIFCHANTWAVIAECLLGNGDRAFEYYRKLLPSVASDEEGQEHWGREPYVFTSSVIGPAQGSRFGTAGISWLTGTASWAYIAATQHILGIQPTLEGLRVTPCLPSHWNTVSVSRRFRGQIHRIEIDNSSGSICIDGIAMPEIACHVGCKLELTLPQYQQLNELAYKQNKMMNKPIGYGIVGVGGFGAARRKTLRDAGCFEIVGGVDPREAAFLDAEKEEGKNFHRYDSVEALVADPLIQAVFISTPAHLHVGQAMVATKAGKAIFVEKPLGDDPKACAELVEYCENNRIPHGHGFGVARFSPLWQHVKNLLDEEALGRVVSVSAASMHTGGLAFSPDSWRFSAGRNPGGPLFQCGIHKIDLLRFLFGEGRWIAGIVNRTITSSPTDDSYVLLGKFGGVPATLHSHYVASYRHAVEIYGTKGSLFITEHPTRLEHKITDLTSGFEPVHDITSQIPFLDAASISSKSLSSKAELDSLRDFAAAVRERRQPRMSGREGLKTLELVFEAAAIAEETPS